MPNFTTAASSIVLDPLPPAVLAFRLLYAVRAYDPPERAERVRPEPLRRVVALPDIQLLVALATFHLHSPFPNFW